MWKPMFLTSPKQDRMVQDSYTGTEQLSFTDVEPKSILNPK